MRANYFRDDPAVLDLGVIALGSSGAVSSDSSNANNTTAAGNASGVPASSDAVVMPPLASATAGAFDLTWLWWILAAVIGFKLLKHFKVI